MALFLFATVLDVDWLFFDIPVPPLRFFCAVTLYKYYYYINIIIFCSCTHTLALSWFVIIICIIS